MSKNSFKKESGGTVKKIIIRGAVVRMYKTKGRRGKPDRRGRPRDRPGTPRSGAESCVGFARGGKSLETPRVNDDRRRHSARQRRSTPTLGTDARRRHSAPTLGSDTRRRHSAPTLGTRIHHECTLSPIAPPECTHQSALWRMHSGRPKGEAQSAVTRAWRPSHREQYRNRHTRARRRIVGCTDRLDENVKTAL